MGNFAACLRDLLSSVSGSLGALPGVQAEVRVEVRTISGATVATASMPLLLTGAAVKARVALYAASRGCVIQSLVTEDGRILEDTGTLAELGISDVICLTAVQGRPWWVGEWVSCKNEARGSGFFAVLSNDLRVGDYYMDVSAHLFIRANGEADLVSCSGGRREEDHFRGQPPSGGQDTFTVRVCGKQRDALEGLRLVRQPGGTLRAYHLGRFFSWLREESAYIEYEEACPGDEASSCARKAAPKPEPHPELVSPILCKLQTSPCDTGGYGTPTGH